MVCKYHDDSQQGSGSSSRQSNTPDFPQGEAYDYEQEEGYQPQNNPLSNFGHSPWNPEDAVGGGSQSSPADHAGHAQPSFAAPTGHISGPRESLFMTDIPPDPTARFQPTKLPYRTLTKFTASKALASGSAVQQCSNIQGWDETRSQASGLSQSDSQEDSAPSPSQHCVVAVGTNDAALPCSGAQHNSSTDWSEVPHSQTGSSN